MPYKDKEKQRAAQKAWYEKNKAELASLQRDRRSNKRKFIEQYKTDNSICSDCKISYPPHMLDFDHLADKSFGIGGNNSKNRSLDAIQAEIEKCEIVCSNCHRHRTWTRAKNSPRPNKNQ